MATGRTTKLTGAVGEFLVAAELCRRNLLATPFAGNVPHYDVIASGQSGGHVAVQVKAINGSGWQFDISKYADVRLTEGDKQVVGRPIPEPFPGLICVLVALQGTGQDRFFVIEWKKLRNILVRNHRAYLSKHHGKRPRAPRSFHTALGIKDVETFENQWHRILDRVPGAKKHDTRGRQES
ncbi:MAG: hypothetical protein ACE14M_03475 [Terriglobales bacterium]